MTIDRNKTTINLTEGEKEAIKTISKLTHDLYYGFNDDELNRFDEIMRKSCGEVNTKVSILNFSCLVADLQKILMNLIINFFL